MKQLVEILGQPLMDRIKKDHETVHHNKPFRDAFHPDLLLFTKWAYRVGKGWYGFSLGQSVPMSWVEAISRVLEYIGSKDDDFEIHQIKLKFGGLRFYVSYKEDPEITSIIDKLEEYLCDDKLIY